MKKLALEGTSFSGKSSLARELIKGGPERYKLVEEYVVYAGGGKNFPPYPPKNKQEALSALQFFIDLEEKRHQDIAKFSGKPYILVMDRSVISLLGFRYAQKHLGGIDIFKETQEILKDRPDLGPDYVVYLAASDQAIAERQLLSQRAVGDLFVDPEFNNQLRRFFDWLEEHKQYPLITISTDKSLDEVKKEVATIADGLPT